MNDFNVISAESELKNLIQIAPEELIEPKDLIDFHEAEVMPNNSKSDEKKLQKVTHAA
jgi:hypothetical protein